jgi:alkylation response protein AidB-like acyl-CoA dehydrogenase
MSSLDSLLPPEGSEPVRDASNALIGRAYRVAEEVLAPRAEETDRAPILPTENLEAVADAGLLGLSGSLEYGGQSAPGTVSRQVAEILAGACGVTHFVQAQHHGPVGMIAGTENTALKERYLRALCEGNLLAGVAFSHLRRLGAPVVAATPLSGGYQINGTAPWVTSWGLAGIFIIAASLPEDRILYFCQEGRATESLRPSEPLRLAAMNASSTVRLSFHDLFVPEEAVVRIAEGASWRERDRINTAHANPAVFGIAATCLRHMEEIVQCGGSETAAQAIEALSNELNDCRSAAYSLADSGAGTAEIPELLRVKAWSLDLAARVAHAFIAAVGGRAMSQDHPAQRLMREAMFYTIQAQTSAVRDATLAALSPRGDDREVA